MNLTYRNTKGFPLSHAELDGNFQYLQAGIGSQAVFGAHYDLVGDGVTDNYANLTAALLAAAGKKLILPPGNFRIQFSGTSALSFNANNTMLEAAVPGATTLTFVPADATDRNCFQFNASNIYLRGIKTDIVAPANASISLLFANAGISNLNFEYCDLDGAVTNSGASISHAAHGLKFPNAGTVTDINFFNCDLHRVRFGLLKANASTAVVRRISFAHCDLYENYNEDLSFNSPNGEMDDVQVYMCRFRDGNGASASLNQLHIALASVKNFRISGNHHAGVVSNCVHLEEGCDNGTVAGNTGEVDLQGSAVIQILDNNIGGTSKMPQNISISSNNFKKAGTQKEAGTYGIWLVNDASPEVPAKNIKITDNNMIGFETGYLSGATLDDGCQISGNTAESCSRGFDARTSAIVLTDNVSRNCDTGVYGEAGAVFKNHTFINCTTNADSATNQIVLLDPLFIYPEFIHPGGSTSAFKNIIPIPAGTRVHGFLEVTYRFANNPVNNAFTRDEVLWDGTTFTRTNKLDLSTGGVDAVAANNGGNLAINIFSSGSSSSGDLIVKLSGMAVIAV